MPDKLLPEIADGVRTGQSIDRFEMVAGFNAGTECDQALIWGRASSTAATATEVNSRCSDLEAAYDEASMNVRVNSAWRARNWTKFTYGVRLWQVLFFFFLWSGSAAVPPERSTLYDGDADSGYTHPYQADYNSSVYVTIEAWIYRLNAEHCETILSQGLGSSFWFGLCPNLRFYRSGWQFADSGVQVPAFRWTHVAVTYDNSDARFFVDGELVAIRALSNIGPGGDNPLEVGQASGGYRFEGYLDEIRLWTVARSMSAIQAGMFQEIRTGVGLAAVFAEGGRREALGGSSAAGRDVRTSPLGILPRALRVPEASVPVAADGNIDTATEYANAEQLVLRYKPEASAVDTAALLVYRNQPDDENLYIAIPQIRLTDPDQTWIGVLLDPNHLQREFAGSQDRQLRIPMNGGEPEWHQGTGFGGYFPMVPQPDSTLWDVTNGFCGEFTPCIEIRIAESLLNDFIGTNGIALIHRYGAGAGEHDMGPPDAVYTSPETWAPMSYGPEAPTSVTTFSGTVINPITATGIADYPVLLVDESSGALIEARNTGADGSFLFANLRVPQGRKMKLVIDQCVECRVQDATSSGGGTAPERIGPLEVVFPACGTAFCVYAPVTFRIEQSVGPIGLTDFHPKMAAPEIVLRDSPLKRLPPDTVTIQGENLHSSIRVFLYSCLDTPPLSSCVLGRDYFEAEIIARAPSGASVTVRMPPVPSEDWSRPWFWVVQDTWVRSGRQEWTRIGDRPENPFFLAPGAYPKVHGFEFENESIRAEFDEFSAVFGDNAYICLGVEVDGNCAGCRVLDPLYGLYGIIYTIWMDDINGSCNGMASTSLLNYLGDLQPASFQAGARAAAGLLGNYAASTILTSAPVRASVVLNSSLVPPRLEAVTSTGFFDTDWGAYAPLEFESGYRLFVTNVLSASRIAFEDISSPPITNELFFIIQNLVPFQIPQYDVDLCGPFSPRNLWAHIRVNHGVQTSAEAIDAVLAQMNSSGAIPDAGAPASIRGNPVECLSYVRGHLGRCVISMLPEVGRGHVVTPFAVEPVLGQPEMTRIRVYDNNWPEDPTRSIIIDSSINRYSFDKGRETWRGTGIYYIPIAVWQNPRSAPGFATFGELAGLLAFGDAHAHHIDSAGRQWGWDAAGEFHETLPDVSPIALTGGLDQEPTRNVALYLPARKPLPETTIHVTGDRYVFHAAHGGNLFQLEMFSGVPGDKDRVQVFSDGVRLNGFRFSPERTQSGLEPRIGMTLGERQRAVFQWEGLQLSAGEVLGFYALQEARGVRLENPGVETAKFYLQLQTVDGASSTVTTNRFGPIQLPPGANQTVAIANWPEATQLQSAFDLDQDGVTDVIEFLEPVGAGPQPEPPTIQAVWSEGSIHLSWPAETTQFELEATDSLSDILWWTVQSKPVLEGNRYSVPVKSAASAQFYRLRSIE